jgi:hypothetical protein
MLHLDTGNTGFMILCTSLVMLMTPGLAFFYGGLVGRKNVLAIMIQSFVSMGWTTVIWYLYGYSLCFSGDWHGVIGNLHNVCLRGIGLNTPSPNETIPAFVFIAYQMMFAIITPALISGAFTNRVTFKAYMLFLTGWLTFVYFPFVHMVWGGGFLQQWGVKDFAGGIVVHNIAGVAALASVLYVGKAPHRGSRPAQHPAGCPGNWPAVVWLVRLQRGQRNARGFRHRDRISQHRRGRLFRGRCLVAGGMVQRKKAQVPRPADRSALPVGDGHSRRRICFSHHRGHHRISRRSGLLLRGGDEEQTALG